MSGTKSKSRQSFVDPFEVGREIVHTGKQEIIKETPKAFLSQLLGINLDEHQGAKSSDAVAEKAAQANPHSGEIFNLAKHQPSSENQKPHAEKAPKPKHEAAPGLDYHHEIVKSGENHLKREHQEVKQNVEQIKVEIARLIASTQDLKMEFASITVEQSMVNVGQYHLNFFEWMLTVIRSARQKVEDSQSWMGAVKGKGAKRDYWGMFKKHGTTFGQSGERSVATSVG